MNINALQALRCTLVIAASALLLAIPSIASAQSPVVLYACYVPASGTVYRIKTSDTADKCRGGHVEFQWQASGTSTGGEFSLPYSATLASAGPLFFLTNQGTGATVRADNTGGGFAIRAQSSSGPAATIHAENFGTGTVGYFKNRGGGGAVHAEATTTGNPAVTAWQFGSGAGVHTETHGTGPALYAAAKGTGSAVYALAAGDQSFAVYGEGVGSYPVAQFHAKGTGPALRTFGNVEINGNYMATGTKNAVVATASGDRKMYTEEATEVWFTDYGFGKLDGDVVWIPIDETFAGTISPDEAYHVFLQPYGPADLYVAERTPEGFAVALRKGSESAEFSYRLVAKRKGYETDRMELAPQR